MNSEVLAPAGFVEPAAPTSDFFATGYSDAIREFAPRLGERFEVLILDEVQDFRPEWLAALPHLLDVDGPARQFRLGAMGMGMSNAFTINGRSFDPARVDTTVALGDIEDWLLINQSGMDHPFHIHTNSFQIAGQPAWYDVALVPAMRSLRIRQQFSDYTGKAMYHCHILDHEDLGMMGVIEFT